MKMGRGTAVILRMSLSLLHLCMTFSVFGIRIVLSAIFSSLGHNFIWQSKILYEESNGRRLVFAQLSSEALFA